MDRREFLERAGGFVAVAGFSGPFRLAEKLRDPRLRELDKLVQGDVLGRDDSGYAAARTVYSTRATTQPFAIVYAESVRDVQRTLLWARRHKLRIAPRSGGHSYGGYSLSTGVVVDVSRLHGIAVGQGNATIGAGAKLYDVVAALAQHGVTIPAGSCPTVGIAGLTLGGGVGYASRKLGLTCDSLQEVRIVTADGKLRIANAKVNPDLLWACRGGGGGNFGIVTSFRFRTHSVGPIAIYRAQWPWDQARKVVAAWAGWAPHAPDELFAVCDLIATDRRAAAPGPRLHVTSGGQFFGTPERLQALLQQLFAVAGKPTQLTVQAKTLLGAAQEWAGCRDAATCSAPERATFKAKSWYVRKKLPGPAIDVLVQSLELRAANPDLNRGAIYLDPMGGAINRVPKAASAFVHRDELVSIQAVAAWEATDPQRVADANLTAQRALADRLRPFVSGASYQNYIDPELAGWAHAYYGANLPRLARVKRRYDPGDVFRFAQSVPLHL